MNISLLYAAARLLAMLALFMGLPEGNSMQSFITTRIEIETDKLETPVKIAVLSDLHLHQYGENNNDLIEAVRQEKPDLIAVTGDMMNKGNRNDSVVISLCRELVKIAPVYYVYGNHEYDMITQRNSQIGANLRALGVHVLINEWETVSIGENLVDIFGIDRVPRECSPEDLLQIDDWLASPNYHLLLVHDPGYFDIRYPKDPEISLIGKPIDAALCGHRHGGQVDLPYFGGLYNPDVGFFPEFTAGDTVVEGTHVIVSRGLGDHNHAKRINNPHELLIVTLR